MSPLLIYDGRCPFCTAQAEKLKGRARGLLEIESFHDPKTLARFPNLSYDACMKEIKLVTPKGKILGGAEAIFYALSLPPFWRPLRWVYAIPILKQIFDWGYGFVARNRYRIQKRECPSGTCSRHQHEE